MRTQLANRIHIIPTHDVLSVEDDTITLKTDKSFYEFFTDNDLIFSEKETESHGTDMYSQELSIVLDVDKAAITKLYNRQLIVKLFDNKSNIYLWGDLDNPIDFKLKTHLDKYSLSLSRIGKTPIF